MLHLSSIIVMEHFIHYNLQEQLSALFYTYIG